MIGASLSRRVVIIYYVVVRENKMIHTDMDIGHTDVWKGRRHSDHVKVLMRRVGGMAVGWQHNTKYGRAMRNWGGVEGIQFLLCLLLLRVTSMLVNRT